MDRHAEIPHIDQGAIEHLTEIKQKVAEYRITEAQGKSVDTWKTKLAGVCDGSFILVQENLTAHEQYLNRLTGGLSPQQALAEAESRTPRMWEVIIGDRDGSIGRLRVEGLEKGPVTSISGNYSYIEDGLKMGVHTITFSFGQPGDEHASFDGKAITTINTELLP